MLAHVQTNMFKQFTVNTPNGPVIEVRISDSNQLVARVKQKSWSNGTVSYWVYDNKGTFIDSGKKSDISKIVSVHLLQRK